MFRERHWIAIHARYSNFCLFFWVLRFAVSHEELSHVLLSEARAKKEGYGSHYENLPPRLVHLHPAPRNQALRAHDRRTDLTEVLALRLDANVSGGAGSGWTLDWAVSFWNGIGAPGHLIDQGGLRCDGGSYPQKI